MDTPCELPETPQMPVLGPYTSNVSRVWMFSRSVLGLGSSAGSGCWTSKFGVSALVLSFWVRELEHWVFAPRIWPLGFWRVEA